jgi:ferredoxin-thioredoxin reductase catalytic subunit
MKDIKLINIKELKESHCSLHLNEEIVPYEDIQMIDHLTNGKSIEDFIGTF